LISIRRQMNEAERLADQFCALVNAFVGLTGVLPKTALPADPESSRRCKEDFNRVSALLRDNPSTDEIRSVGRSVVERVEEIGRTNKAALDDFDGTIRDVVATVAAAISGFKGHGQRHESSLTKLADGFDALARVDDVVELRRRLREDVLKLRQSAEELRHESEESVRHLESRISAFQERMEAVRRGSDIDRLTQLGSRRAAERCIQTLPEHRGPICVLVFDVEGFRRINDRYGRLFGDKLLQALAHLLTESFPGEGSLFRWGPDEFLATSQCALPASQQRCRSVCDEFAASNYTTYEGGRKERVTATILWGAAQYEPGESMVSLCGRARENLEQNRKAPTR
jgi:diguanylate cyclase (GGDEF)-like protein